MPSATAQFVGIPELLSCFGRVVVNRELLRHLCLASKSFRAAFTPFLYAEVWFRSNNARFLVGDLQILLNNSSLRYTRTLDIAISPHSHRDPSHTAGALSELYNEGVQALLECMPGLTCFSWEDVPLYTNTISTLYQRCPRLQSLIIRNELHLEERLSLIDDDDFRDGFYERRPMFATQDLSPFSNLVELQVYEIYGDIVRARRDFAQVLLRSPHLKTLGLSISSDAVERIDFHETAAQNKYLLFLKTLADEYVAAGGRPLKLKKLVLGLGILLWQTGTYFPGLVDLKTLEDVYISNQDVDVSLYFPEDEDNIQWTIFNPNQCPNLYALGVHDLSQSVSRWIGALKPGYIRQFQVMGDEIDGALNQIVSKLGHPRTASDKTSMIISETMDFELVEIQNIQAMAFCTHISIRERQPSFLQWLQSSTDLRQLYVRTDSARPNQPDVETLKHEIATICKKLIYLRLNNEKWRIWRDGNSETEMRFENLDRFESREIEVFHAWGYFRSYV